MLSSGGEDRKTCRESTVPCDGLARAAGLNVSVLNILHTLHAFQLTRSNVCAAKKVCSRFTINLVNYFTVTLAVSHEQKPDISWLKSVRHITALWF